MSEKLNHNPETNQTNPDASKWEGLSEVPFAGSRIEDIDKAQAMAEAADEHMTLAARCNHLAKTADNAFRQFSAERATERHLNNAAIAEERAAQAYDGIDKNQGPIQDIDKARAMAEAENLSQKLAAEEERAANIIESEDYKQRGALIKELEAKGFNVDQVRQIFSNPDKVKASSAKHRAQANKNGERAGLLYDAKNNQ